MNYDPAIEAESLVLAAVLNDHVVLDEISFLRPEDFSRDDLRLIFGAVTELARRGVTVEILSVSNALKSSGQLDRAGGPGRVSEIACAYTTSHTIVHYAAMVRDHAVRRNLMTELSRVWHEDQNGPEDVGDWLAKIPGRFERIVSRAAATNATSPSQDVAEAFAQIEALVEGRADAGIKTGFDMLDRYLGGGFRPGELIVIAARPGVGKSALALQLALRAATDGHAAALFSLEMSRGELYKRALCQIASVPLDALRLNGVQGADWRRFTGATETLAAMPLRIYDPPGSAVAQAAALARRIKRESGLDLLIVDYIQLLAGDRKRGDNREREVADVSRTLKLLAREIEAPVIALSQLNRAPDDRSGRARLSDLRESGAIEQDADCVLALSRPGLYDPQSYEAGYTIMEILKQRNGPAGIHLELAFNGRLTTFAPWDGKKGGKRAA